MKVKTYLKNYDYEKIMRILYLLFAYSLPRQTYMPSIAIEVLTCNLDNISKTYKEKMIEDINSYLAKVLKNEKRYDSYALEWLEFKEKLIASLSQESTKHYFLLCQESKYDVVFTSCVRCFLFYHYEGKEKIFNMFDEIKDSLMNKTLQIMERDIREEIYRPYPFLSPKECEERENFHQKVLTLLIERNIKKWN